MGYMLECLAVITGIVLLFSFIIGGFVNWFLDSRREKAIKERWNV